MSPFYQRRHKALYDSFCISDKINSSLKSLKTFWQAYLEQFLLSCPLSG
jgi:hypothetical protein